MSKQHGTALKNTPGHLANFLGSFTRAATLAANQLPADLIEFWGNNQDHELQRKILTVLQEPVQRSILRVEMEKILSIAFGKKIKVPNPPLEFTEENLAKWTKMNFHPLYLPKEQISQERKLEDWVKPNNWFYQKIKEEKISSKADMLPGSWYLVDFTEGVDYTDGSQVFPNDPLSPIIIELRKQNKVGKDAIIPMGSRFSIIPKDEWPLVCQAVLKELGLNPKRAICRLERAIEFNAIGNLFDKNRGKFNIWEWFSDIFEDANRLIGGHRDSGGLSNASYFWAGERDGSIAGRPLVSFV